MLFPYRARITLFHIPWVTALVCVLCVWVFWAQSNNHRAILRAADGFCERENSPTFVRALQWIGGDADASVCAQIMMQLSRGSDDRADVAALAQHANPKVATGALAAHYTEALLGAYRSFKSSAPANLTARLWYTPGSANPVRMVTAAFAHGSWSHLIGNLLFFFAFAATIEILLGPVLFLAVFAVFAIGTHSVYSLAMMGNAQGLPTIGLSGVVMGMIALFVYFIPQARISCFLWLVVFYRRFAVPAWVLAAWFIGWDIYSQLRGGQAGTNLIAHLSGAALGFLLGFTLFRAKRHWAHELVEE